MNITRTRKQKGFTLLEIIIVIAIMGFLIAMLAMRLGGVGQDAETKVDETNLQRISDVVSVMVTNNKRLPNKMVSIVDFDGSSYTIPSVGTVDSPGGVLNGDFANNNDLTVHILDASEAAALRNYGLTQVLVLDSTTTGPLAQASVSAGLGVAMIGGGSAAGALSAVTAGDFILPEGIYRIVMGVNNDCSLVDEGLISSAPTSPASTQNDDIYTYGYYNVILPRLQATVNRTLGTNSVTAVGNTTGQTKTVTLNTDMEMWQYTVMSPEGKSWPKHEDDLWAVTP